MQYLVFSSTEGDNYSVCLVCVPTLHPASLAFNYNGAASSKTPRITLAWALWSIRTKNEERALTVLIFLSMTYLPLDNSFKTTSLFAEYATINVQANSVSDLEDALHAKQITCHNYAKITTWC